MSNKTPIILVIILFFSSFVDAQIGRIVSAVEQSDFADNTIIVVWGDHGWHLGEKDITGKNTLWDRGTKVPLVFAGPGITPQQILTFFF